MSRVTRRSWAVILAVVIGGVPLVADWCAVACEAAHATAAAGVPACHHAGSASARIGELPMPCSHDHHPVSVDAATTIAIASRAQVVAPVVAIAAIWSSPATTTHDVRSIGGDTSSPGPARTLSLILRI